MWGRLEHEIRLLPQVLACSTSPDDAVVLIAPSADRAAVERAALAIIRDAGAHVRLRVLGGEEPLALRTRTAIVPQRAGRILLGAVAGTALLAVSSLVGGLTFREPGGGPAGSAVRRPAPIETNDEFLFPRFPRFGRAADELDGQVEKVHSVALRVPARAPERVSAPRLTSDRRTRSAVDPSPATPTTSVTGGCDHPGDRGAPRARHGRHVGDGPPPWSWSVLVPPHEDCSRGRPR